MYSHIDRFKISEIESWLITEGFSEILKSDIVQRLKHVRFLGTMKYIVSLKYEYSRYDHSLFVAKLADIIAQKLSFNDEYRRMLILMGLLHDIGHLPFSHASEVFFRQTWGKYHTGHGSRLLYHLSKSLELNGDRKLAILVDEANKYLHGKFYDLDNYFGLISSEIFHGPLSIDTLDGIIRAAKSIGIPYPDINEIINGFGNINEKLYINQESWETILKFFLLKKTVYNDYVYSTNGIAAEAMLTKVLEITFGMIEEKDDFISLNDNLTIEKIRYNPEAYELFSRLEQRKLYHSLNEVNIEKFKYLKEAFHHLNLSERNVINVIKELEKYISNDLNVPESWIIIHSTIKLKFKRIDYLQGELFSLPLSMKKIRNLFKTEKSYGNEFDLFFSIELIDKINRISVPSEFVFERQNLVKKSSVGAIEKHRGAYMTPEIIADFLINCSINKNLNIRILDPAAGEGVFLKAAYRRMTSLGIKREDVIKNLFGIEIDKQLWKTLCNLTELNISSSNLSNQNFFEYFKKFIQDNKSQKFDLLVGNPPYIKYHSFVGNDRELALNLAKELDVKFSERISSWAPYLLFSAHLLKDNGTLAMVLPSELLTTDYARPLRRFLLKRFKSMTFVFIKNNVFLNAQQEVLLLIAHNNEPFGVNKLEVEDYEKLDVNSLSSKSISIKPNNWLGDKWTHLMISEHSLLPIIDSMINNEDIIEFGSIADISIGLVTGDNSYFILDPANMKTNKIAINWTRPIISKANQLKGLQITNNDFWQIINSGVKCYLLCIPTTASIQRDQDLMNYLELGKRNGVNQGNKCRTRWPWYSVPMQQIPDAFLTYMANQYFKVTYNNCNIYSTNTIHNVYFNKDINVHYRKAYIVTMYSSLCRLSAELVGRSYGGGVLKLEIGEANRLLLPNLKKAEFSSILELEKILESYEGEIKNNESKLFQRIDEIVLHDILKLNEKTIVMIKSEGEKLTRRRLLRKHIIH